MIRLKKFRCRRLLLQALCLYLAYFVLASLLPYIVHKDVSSTFLASFRAEDCYSDTIGTERVACVEDNLDALLLRFQLMEQAQSELIYTTFDFFDDDSGCDVIAALLAAADRGVQVKVLIDGFSSTWTMAGSKSFQALASHENIEVKRYNPFTLLKPWRNQARMHDKYLIVDDTAYLLGGRNTSDLFLGQYSETYNQDREILVCDTAPSENSSLSQLKAYFQAVWQLPCSKPYSYHQKADDLAAERSALKSRYEALKGQYPEAFQKLDLRLQTIETRRVRLLHNPIHPGNKEPELWYALSQLMQSADRSLLQTPYVICSRSMYHDLQALSGAGKEISILTNAPECGANVFGTGDLRLEKRRILQCGVQLFAFAGQQSSHTKSVLIGDRLSIIGSYNFDMRSTYLDTELMVVVDSPEFNAQMQKSCSTSLSQSRRLLPDGSWKFGENYVPKKQGPIITAFTTFLAILARPFRFLL